MTDYVDYYIEWDCPSCDETNYAGINRSFLTHKGLPVIPFDDGACQNFSCSECGMTCYSGDLELMTDA